MAGAQERRVKRIRRVTIEIPLPSRRGQPKRLYCSGPPPPPITLVPPRDSKAYIVNKLVLPSPRYASTDPSLVQRRLYYTIGWADLVSARAVVLASRVLDYVSPWELEEWEYNEFLRREDEKALAQIESVATPQKKKKPGRPRKRPADPLRGSEEAGSEKPAKLDSETEAILASKQAAGRPSLSTPSKRKLAELLRETDAEETGTEYEDAAIARQLYSESEEAGYPSEAQYGDEMDYSEAVDLLEPGVAGSSSRASSLTAPPIRAPIGAGPSTGQKQSTAGSSPVAFPPVTAYLPGARGGKVPPSVLTTLSKLEGARPVAPPQPAVTPRREPQAGSRASTRASSPLTSAYFKNAPSANGALPPPRREKTGFTPVTITPVRVGASSSLSSAREHPLPPEISTPSANNSSPESTQPRPRKRRKKPEPQEVEWRVKRLEGDRYDYDANGDLKRYFKVLWDGDWPPSQNPSWEPEENISEGLKEDYLRRKEGRMTGGYLTKAAGAGKSSSPAKPTNTTLRKGGAAPPRFLPRERYSSVAEAFEAGMHDVEGPARGWGDDTVGKDKGKEEEGEEDEEETFVVTDEPPSAPDDRALPSFSVFDRTLASYRSAYRRQGR